MHVERPQAPKLDYIRGGKQKARYTEQEVVEWPCPLCGASDRELIKQERGALAVVRCVKCTLIRVSPRLHHPEQIYQGDVALYENEYREVLRGRPHHRDANYLRDIALLAKHKPTGRFLDIGSSTGAFLHHALNRGWTVTGIEPSSQLASLARKWWGLEIIEGFVEKLDLPARHFDVVTMTDVFEHVVNPKEVLGAIRRTIKDDGILFIKVPNGLFNILKYNVRKLLKKTETDDFDAYEHVLHYTDQTLTAMLRACGFEPFDVQVETPVQLPVWHKYVGQYFQHESPFFMDWRTYSGREAAYRLAQIERALTRRIGYLAPNIGCLARPQ
jgi:2-polyprenyl-3-methyl-5-hydroxy-6-metoxy-1,4-benzoquinol methylase